MTQPKKQSIAVIGSGISGLGAAWLLKDAYDVCVFEKNHYSGGHSNTVEVDYDGARIAVDTGFIVYNHRTYPHLKALFEYLKLPVVQSNMSFGVSIDNGRLEYASHNISSIFATRGAMFSPAFVRMMLQVLRFNRVAASHVNENAEVTLGALLDKLKLGEWFRHYYLLPMAGAIWSCPLATMLDYPASTFLRFFENHGLLSVNGHPQWYSVQGGSREYVKRLVEPLAGRVYLNTPVEEVRSEGGQVVVRDAVAGREQKFDHVIIATHGNQALQMLSHPTQEEADVLSAFDYQGNRAVLHRDASLMPKRKNAWASWNYLTHFDTPDTADLAVTYWMNSLQNIDRSTPLFVTLNPVNNPRDELTFAEFRYEHPIFNCAAIAAQKKLPSLQGKHNIWFTGSYHRYGFHEDGLMSAVSVANALGVKAPWQ